MTIPIHPSSRTPAVFPLPLPIVAHRTACPIPAPPRRRPSLRAAAEPESPQAAPLPNDAVTAHHSPQAIENTAKTVNSPLNPNANCHPPPPPIAELPPIIRRQHQRDAIPSNRPSSRVFCPLSVSHLSTAARNTVYNCRRMVYSDTNNAHRRDVKSRRKTTVKNGG